ncbi:anti-sigma factor [Demequina sp. NBRC 110056]|uniref:anti-sigma factor n=1 Tax=Demequina sp. NBRC 110056 TaxID=1570345 RepID=UPI000A039E34|nr:anti-sigma factor [Demequina sp. NBRC 110056]
MITDIHALAAPYAVDALDPAEREAFERHLPGCEECLAEVAGFTAATASLADAEATAPPSSLRASVLSEIARTAQLPPVVTSTPSTDPIAVAAPFGQPSSADAPAGVDSPSPADGSGGVDGADAAAGSRPGAPGAASRVGSDEGSDGTSGAADAGASSGSGDADGSGQGSSSADELAGRRSSRGASGARRWWPALAGAAATAAVFAVAWGLAGPSGDEPSSLAMEKDVMMIESAPDAKSMDMDLGTGHLVMSDRMDGYALMGSAAPMPTKGTEYQVWLILEDGSKVAGPTFMPDDAGGYMTVVHTDDDVVAVAITCEPPGGSDEPTSDVVSVVEL